MLPNFPSLFYKVLRRVRLGKIRMNDAIQISPREYLIKHEWGVAGQ
jgi:hypothetical protein